MKKEFVKIKIKKDFGDFKKDQIIKVDSKGGIPLEKFWRRRLTDAKQDDCCEIVEGAKTKTKQAKQTNK